MMLRRTRSSTGAPRSADIWQVPRPARPSRRAGRYAELQRQIAEGSPASSHSDMPVTSISTGPRAVDADRPRRAHRDVSQN